MPPARTPALLVLAVLAGCGGGGPEAGSFAKGKRVFTTAGCGACHTLAAAHAHGQPGPDFDTSERLTRRQIRATLTRGVGGMPSFAGKLSAEQLDDVAEFVYEAQRGRR